MRRNVPYLLCCEYVRGYYMATGSGTVKLIGRFGPGDDNTFETATHKENAMPIAVTGTLEHLRCTLGSKMMDLELFF